MKSTRSSDMVGPHLRMSGEAVVDDCGGMKSDRTQVQNSSRLAAARQSQGSRLLQLRRSSRGALPSERSTARYARRETKSTVARTRPRLLRLLLQDLAGLAVDEIELVLREIS